MRLFSTFFVRICLQYDTVLLLRLERHFSFRFTLEIESVYTIATFFCQVHTQQSQAYTSM